MLLSTWSGFLSALLASFTSHRGGENASLSSSSSALQFELRHYHAVSPAAQVLFHDARPHAQSLSHTSHTIRTRSVKTHRPSTLAAFAHARTRSIRFAESVYLDWDEDEVQGPNIESRETLLELAKMTNDAYLSPGESGWYDLGNEWNVSYPFGWEPDADGFRGHVFATSDNSTVVLSIKGTSAGFLGGGGPTTKKDKFNDNLLFSCCCARIDWTWTVVCDCYLGGWKCDKNCLEESLIEESLFYSIGTNLYNNLTYMYPESNIWVIGHSLGGALASMLGVTFGVPVVAIESPGEKMAARRLHLPTPPEVQHITHVYHTADPIAMGTCNGVLSSCALGGYAMESRCHLGLSVVYDTVSNLSWAVDIRTHGIVNVIEKVLSQPWPPSVGVGREVPEAKPEEDCVECYSWDFGDHPFKKKEMVL
ncbi:alpha/beta-hydrolase [Wolfiporia cocos MD-104 SS10]|uniref:triacylglycerol lipase n=1 Tax=Wolfiporia cocos (strain MD-104) TaxID=742152 RepID=A0A2H3JT79_WOLCO|nr:alpha/beta-hydrolase [Wolfiporia cocos MD-104 SS10]